MELKIEYLDKAELKPYANNAKIHTAEQIEQIKKSIKQFGFNDPIAVWKENEIIEGHGRLLAIMEMDDIKKVPVIKLDNLTDEQRKAYMLVHNQLAMSTGFDFDLLREELEKITSIEMEDYGFIAEEQLNADIDDFFSDYYIPEEKKYIVFNIQKPKEFAELKEYLVSNDIRYKEK